MFSCLTFHASRFTLPPPTLIRSRLMIVVMRSGFAEAELQRVVEYVEEAGLQVHLSRGEEHAIVGVVGVPIPDQLQEDLEILPGVQQVLRVSKRYKRASRDFQPVPSVVPVSGAVIG